mgnify:CR=1 FL=1
MMHKMTQIEHNFEASIASRTYACTIKLLVNNFFMRYLYFTVMVDFLKFISVLVFFVNAPKLIKSVIVYILSKSSIII